MHLARRLAALVGLLACMAAPATALETDLGRFPFATDAGEYADLVVYPEGERAMRLVFPALTVERPSENRAVLRPGGEGRVIVQTARGARGGFENAAVLVFGKAPVVLDRRGDRVDMRLSLRALGLPLRGRTDGALGRVAFEGMLATLSLPVRPSPAIREGTFSLKAASTRADASLFGAAGASTVATGAVDISGALGLRMPTLPDGAGDLMRSILNARLDRSSVEMFGGRVSAAGYTAFPAGGEPPVSDLRGRVVIDDFPIMMQGLMRSGLVAPQHAFPLVAVAGSLGTLSPDGALSFDVATTPGGDVVVNGKPLSALMPPR